MIRTIALSIGCPERASVMSPATIPTRDESSTSLLAMVPGTISISSTRLRAYPVADTSSVLPLWMVGILVMEYSPLSLVMVV